MKIILAMVLVSAAIQAKAEISVKEYRAGKSADGGLSAENKRYIDGLGDAFGWADARLTTGHLKPLFYAPGKLGLFTENYIEILDSEIEEDSKVSTRKDIDEIFIGLMLLRGLERTFPCKDK